MGTFICMKSPKSTKLKSDEVTVQNAEYLASNPVDDEMRLKTLLEELDALHFGGSIANRVNIYFRPLRSGHYGSFKHGRPPTITISSALKDDPLELRKTVLHEMVHAHHSAIGHPCAQRINDAHGAAFAAEIKRLQAAGEDVAGELEYAICQTQDEESLTHAAKVFLSRRNRTLKPDGHYDNSKWFPSDSERQVCCAPIREPSRNFPFSLLTHCSTITHVSRLFGVDTVALRKRVREIEQEQR